MPKKLFILLLVFFSVSGVAIAEMVECIYVYDGDTIMVKNANGKKIKIRLASIDAPESKQAYGYTASKKLKKLLLNKKINIKIFQIDKYGRFIANIYKNGGGLTINEIMVRDGAAWHYKRYSRDSKLAIVENMARQNKKGLWKNSNPVPPWQWRKK